MHINAYCSIYSEWWAWDDRNQIVLPPTGYRILLQKCTWCRVIVYWKLSAVVMYTVRTQLLLSVQQRSQLLHSIEYSTLSDVVLLKGIVYSSKLSDFVRLNIMVYCTLSAVVQCTCKVSAVFTVNLCYLLYYWKI